MNALKIFERKKYKNIMGNKFQHNSHNTTHNIAK